MDTNNREDVTKIETDFQEKKVAHARLKEIFAQLSLVDKPSHREQVTILTGPTGVGKTTALAHLVRHLLDKHKEQMRKDPGFIPFISLKAVAPLDGNFNWKDAFIRLLEEFNEILIRRKVISSARVELNGDIITNIRTLVREELRRSVRNCVRFRGLLLLILDEASHLLITKSTINYRHQFELIKSIAIEWEKPLILSGGYDLLKILDLNGQLIRRTEVIHFPRYAITELTDEENPDRAEFENIVYTLLEAMPVSKEPGLLNHLDYFYMKSLGCVGLLKTWFQKALEMTLQLGGTCITRAILEATAKPNRELQKILAETKLGERYLEDVGARELARQMGLELEPSLHIVTGNFSPRGGGDHPNKPKSGSGKRIGKRGPSRDPVGELPNAL